MLFNGDNPILRIVGVDHIRLRENIFNVPPRDYAVLSFRIRGSATICGGGDTNYIQTNDILYLPQHMGYTAEYTDTEMLCIHFVTMYDDPEMKLYTFQNGEQLYKMFLQALVVWEEKRPGFGIHSVAQLYSILGKLLENETKTVLPPHFLKALSFINANYRDPNISVNTVCAEAGIGATTFRQLFKKHYQKTPTEYITELRLEHARTLVSRGASVEEATYDSGFNDPKYFARVVKKYFCCTPRDLKLYGK